MAEKEVLIVDDEQNICNLVKHLIQWEELNLKLAGMANSGEEALSFISSHPVDIVITDIKMEDMGGLDLIRAIRDKKMDVYFLVMSGFNYFEYAKKAIEYDVENYILKPINQDELNRTLKRICQKMGLKAQMEQRNRKNSREGFLKRVRHDTDLFAQELDEVNREYDMCLEKGCFYFGILHIDPEKEQELEKKNYQIESIQQAFARYMAEHVFDCITVAEDRLNLLFFINSAQPPIKMRHIIQIFIHQQMLLYSSDQERCNISASICDYAEWSPAMENWYALGRQLLMARLIRPQEGVFCRETTDVSLLPDNLTSIRLNVSKLLEETDIAGLRQLYRSEWENKLKVMADRPYGVIHYLQQITDLLQDLAQRIKNIEERELEEIETLKASMGGLNRLREIYEQNLWIILRDVQEAGKDAEGRMIEKAKRYMEEHYAERLSVETVAGVVFLSPQYFGTQFKQVTGKTFNDYLEELRLSQARELLGKTDLNIKEIAVAVGYNDEKYFSKVFKKSMGVKPTEYRKLHVYFD